MTTLNIFYYDAEKYALNEVQQFYNSIIKHLTPEAAAHTICLPNDWKLEQYLLEDKEREVNNENY